MRDVTYSMSVSRDGYVVGPDGLPLAYSGDEAKHILVWKAFPPRRGYR